MQKTEYHRQLGISLLETVLAASLLGIAVMTVCSLAAGSLRAVRLNQEYEKAWDYIERQLVLIDMAGVDTLRQSGQTSGFFTSQDGRQWRWTAQIAETGIAALYDVTLSMEWDGGGRPRRVQCRTRLCGKPTTVEDEAAAENPSM